LLGVREAASKGLNPRQTSGTQRVKVFEGPYTIHHSVGGLHTTKVGQEGRREAQISTTMRNDDGRAMMMLVVLVLLLVSHSQQEDGDDQQRRIKVPVWLCGVEGRHRVRALGGL